MTSAPLLDTHAWIWWMAGDERLGRQTLRRLDLLPPDARPAVCDISLLEVALLVGAGRIELSSSFEVWLERAAHPETVRILPITPLIAGELARLPTSFNRDPADRVIVATSRAHALRVLTRDARIANSGLARLW